MDSRVWQYTEIENFTASENPEDDSYQLALEEDPLFYPDSEWLDYLNIFDENGNYYTAGVSGDDHQLHYESSTGTFTWNPSFNQYPEYFGMEFEEPLIIEANKTLFFEYVTNMSWAEPFLIEVENINLDSVRVIYDYNYLLKPEYYDWYPNFTHSYESIAYSFKEEIEYEVVQYYYEEFTVYTDVSQYTHTFDIGDLTFEDDFINLSIYKVIGLTPTFETEILTSNVDYNINLNKVTNELSITDLSGYLSKFDQILAIVNFSYGPFSKYSEIYLLDQFNQTYLANLEETFYNYIDIDYSYLSNSGTPLFVENSEIITSKYTQFEAIDYTRNPDMSSNNKLIGYDSGLFDNFEVYYDDSSIIFTADIDMDGEPEYKQTIDVDRDGQIDIVRYGIDDPQGSGDIYWYTVIQHYSNSEVQVKQELGEQKSTEWFDINDRAFAKYDFNIVKLILIVLSLPLLPLHITKMFLPDVDYWAQKATQTLVTSEEHMESDYYSVKVDEDRDGIPDSQISYETTNVDIYYEITEYRETILAAKLQNIFTYLGEYVARSIGSLFTSSYEDAVFNEDLTKECLETGDFSSCNGYTRANAPYLRATYRKFAQNITTTFIDSFEHSSITIIDFDEEGDIEEQRIYTDDFDNNEVSNVGEFFSDISDQYLVTNVDTGRKYDVSFDPELPFTHPANISWQGATWGSDNIPIKFDSFQVIGEYSTSTTNMFEKTIILRIPNRYSLYNDYGKHSRSSVTDGGWAEFEVEGIFITPPDGMVYYTSDIESFIAGTAQTKGHYFYVDSDSNGFYETVYILSNTYVRSDSGVPTYNVMSIGYNYDGRHDFVPYEKIDSTVNIVSDFDNLAGESTMFGKDWVYNFAKLDHVSLLWEQETIWDEYRPKDQIFEIHKLVEMSDKNSKFSELFYQVRHETYEEAWKQYRKQLVGDIIQQVFMSVTAAVLSAVVKSLLSCIPFIGAALAEIFAPLTYFAVYCLLTKFFIDLSIHEAESRMRAETYYPASNDKRDPISLNQKSLGDCILGDSMAAALIGHPGGYYTEVSGGQPGNMYTAELLVSPPNIARMLGSFGGFLELLWENLWNMGKSDPDTYTALNFDDLNLDFFLLTSELPAFNQHSYYYYEKADNLLTWDAWYWANTLGYLESRVNTKSNGQFDTIRPTCIDGVPRYEFVNSTTYETVLPQSVLYRPVVLSQERYNQLNPKPVGLVVQVRCMDYGKTEGVNAYELDSIERQAGYKVKVPLNDNGFEYPIEYISIDVVKDHKYRGTSYFAQDLLVNETYYIVDSGNLYFTKSLEEIIAETSQGFNSMLSSTLSKYSTVYYKVHIVFDLFVPDTTEETSNLALSQATFYTVMDYFNQYTYAEVTANMISEIAYTETVTFWSTLISAPLVFLGSWTVEGTKSMMATAGASSVKSLITSTLKSFILAPIKEVFEEIIKDGFIEALIENIGGMIGLPDDVGFWLSSMATSWRETSGALAQISALGQSLGKGGGLKNVISIIKSGDKDALNSLRKKMSQDLDQQQDTDSQNQQQGKSWQKLIISGFFRGISMVMSTIYFGSFNFFTLRSLKNIITDAKTLSPKAYGEYKAQQHAQSKKELEVMATKSPSMTTGNVLIDNMKDGSRKPTGINQGTLHNLFREMQDTDKDNPPAIDKSILFNPNPMVEQRNELAKKFQQIQINDWINDLTQDPRFEDKKDEFNTIKDEFNTIKQNSKNIDFQKSKDKIIAVIRGALKNEKDLRYIDINGILMYDPNFVLVGLPHFNPEQEIDVVFNQPIKDFVNDLRKKYYTISYDVKLALIKGDKLIDVDESSNEHIAHWLIRNGYSKDETIYILPVDKDYHGPIYEKSYWTEGTPSPYTDHFDKFRNDLRDIAYKSGLIHRYSLSVTSNFLFPNELYHYLLEQFSNLNTGKGFGVKETRIHTIHARLLNGLDSLFKEGQISENEHILFSKEVNDLLNEQYSIYGFYQPNSFYLEGRLNAHKIGDILMDYGFIDKNDVESDLYNFIKPFGGSRGALLMEVAYRGEDNKYRIPYESTYTRLERSFESAIIDFATSNKEITNEIAEIVKEKVSRIIDNFILRIKDAKAARQLFEDFDKKNAKVDLLRRIQICNPALLTISSLKKLSKLLFNDETYLEYIFTTESKLDNRPEPYTLHRITFNVRKWTIDDFDEGVSDSELEDIKDSVENTIYNWMFSNPYTHAYVSESPYRFRRLHSKSFLKLEYEIMQTLTHAVSAYNEKTDTNFKKVLTELGIPSLTMENLLTKGVQSAIIKSLLRAKTTIVSYILDSSMTEQKLQYYDRALAKIDEYLATRYLRLFEEKLVSKRGYNKKLWQDDKVMAYHVISLLCRDLGFDPLTFQPLNPQIFDANPATGLFARHHPDIRRKFSVYLQDLFLVNNIQHRHYDTQISLEDQKTLVKIIRDLIQNDGSGPNKEITANDIEKVFLDNFGDPNKVKFYLDNYWEWQSKDFQKNLKDFNDRRDMIKIGQYEDFIRDEYNDAYRRFFNDAMGILNSLTELSDFRGYRLSRVFSISDIDYLRRVFSI